MIPAVPNGHPVCVEAGQPRIGLWSNARPAGIALINSIGLAGGSSIGPLVIGYLKDMTGSFTSGLLYVVAMLVVGVICIVLVAGRTHVTTPTPSPSTA